MISRVLFESLWLLAAVWLVVQCVFVIAWSRQRSRLQARLVWAALAAAPLLAIASIVVVTPRERIARLCHSLARNVNDGDVVAISRHLAVDFEADELDRDEFLDRLEDTLTRYQVDEPRLRRMEVIFADASTGLAEFHAVAHIRSPELVYERLPSRWRLTWRRDDDAWQVVRLESLPTPPLNISRIRDWLR